VVDAIIEHRDKKRKSKQLKKGCIKVFKFFLSTAGLFLINGLILGLGAFIFNKLEATNELANCRNSRSDYQEAENATLILLMDMAQRMDGVGQLTGDDKQKVVDEFQGYLESFALSVIDTGYSVGKDCELLGTPEGEEYDWSFTQSFVFAVTIATTIGKQSQT